ncbi:unnamed protein product [Closterium sp. Naga37s-1]|nr:unnamed protein product [Closterium sp. Naga37s-1]
MALMTAHSMQQPRVSSAISATRQTLWRSRLPLTSTPCSPPLQVTRAATVGRLQTNEEICCWRCLPPLRGAVSCGTGSSLLPSSSYPRPTLLSSSPFPRPTLLPSSSYPRSTLLSSSLLVSSSSRLLATSSVLVGHWDLGSRLGQQSAT